MIKKTPKEKRLSKKELGFVKDYVKTGNGVRSVLKNYDTEDYSTAGMIASENLKKPKIQKAILSIAEQIPDSLLVAKHLELLNKKEVVTRNNINSGEIEVLPTGQIDPQAVKAGLDMAYKLKGIYAPDKMALTNKDGEDIITDEEKKLLLGLLK